MNKPVVFIIFIIFTNLMLFGIGSCKNMKDNKTTYIAVFKHSTNNNYIVADMINTYRIGNVKKIDNWLNRRSKYSRERSSERIVGLLKHDNITIQISVYLTSIYGTRASAGHDVYFIDENGDKTILSLGADANRQSELAFAKIINNTLFIGLNEPFRTTNIVKIELDRNEYSFTKYNNNIGVIQDIWIKNNGNVLYTTNNEYEQESGIFSITEENTINIIEKFDYSIVEYNPTNNHMIIFNKEKQLFYVDAAKKASIKINTIKNNVYKAFFLEENNVIISSYVEKQNHIANFLFGGNNLDRYYLYYSIDYHDEGDVSIKELKTINSLWCLEQIICR